MIVPKEGFIKLPKRMFYLQVAPIVACTLSPDKYKVIGLPKEKDFDGDRFRVVYYYGTRNGKLLLHTRRFRVYKHKSSLVKVIEKLEKKFKIDPMFFNMCSCIVRDK